MLIQVNETSDSSEALEEFFEHDEDGNLQTYPNDMRQTSRANKLKMRSKYVD